MYIPVLLIEMAFAIAIMAISAYIFINQTYIVSVINRNQINQYNSVFDLFYEIANNPTYSNCVSTLNRTCIANELETFSTVYNLQYASLQFENLYVYNGNSGMCKFKSALCLPKMANNSFFPLCINVCSD